MENSDSLKYAKRRQSILRPYKKCNKLTWCSMVQYIAHFCDGVISLVERDLVRILLNGVAQKYIEQIDG